MRNRLLTITFAIACLIVIAVLVRQANIQPTGSSQPVAITSNRHHLAAGSHHSLYIDSKGQLWAWGNTKYKNGATPIPVKVADNVMTVAAGDTSATTSFYITHDGTLFGWGDSSYGQIGIQSEAPIVEPRPIMTDITAVDAGYDAPYAIDTHSSLWTWGMNNPSRASGDPGKEPEGTLLEPEKVMDLVKLVTSSATHTLSQREDRTLWVWGENSTGELAIGKPEKQTHPYKADLSSLHGRLIVKLATRNKASFAVTEDGTLWTWGSANTSLPGKPTPELPSNSLPVKISFIDNVADIALGDESILILKKDGSVWAYGIGPVTGQADSNWTPPVHILSQAVEIASGSHHALALKKDGTIWSWGDNDAGQLGDGTKRLSLKPVQVHFPSAI